MLRVAIPDDHPAVLAGLRRFFDPQHDLSVIAAAATASELSRQLDGTRADVLVLDYDLTRSDGLSHCRRIKSRSRPPAVVIYSAYSGHALILAARVAGANGVVDKAEPVRHLLAAIRAAAAGELAMPVVPRDAYEAAIANVDDEDMPVLAMLLDGAPLDAIARASHRPGRGLLAGAADRRPSASRTQDPTRRPQRRVRPRLSAAALLRSRRRGVELPRARLCDPGIEAGGSRAVRKAALRSAAPTTSSAHLTPAG